MGQSNGLLRIDELNALKSQISETNVQEQSEDIIDSILDFLLLAYADGKISVEDSLGFEAHPSTDDVKNTIYRKIDGHTFDERVRAYAGENDIPGIMKVLDTEYHRVLNESAYYTAVEGGATKKTWHTMGDDKVRDSHFYLDGTTKEINEMFYTILGNEGLYPGQFPDPADSVNCRCWVTFSK